ncbi:MAG: DUF134 domain-containing protein [Candidatus Cloacimonetes bacterium]|nr:DUF134 domain-containing protein [Candidatus Cloacimonadota bacterium]
MTRPQKERTVRQPPLYTEFKPIRIQRSQLTPIQLSLDEFEAIRLADFLGHDHLSAADEMEISRSTFTRLIEKARSKIAEFLIEGRELVIAGGNIHFRGNLIRCLDCGHLFKNDFTQPIVSCPACDSANLLDLAGGFGHGNCCAKRKRRGR